MKILVVDDEQLAIDNLVSLIREHQPSSNIITSNTASKAVDIFFAEQPNVTYLDINMPGITGIELGKIFTGKSVIVFVTAYSEFAIEAFDLSAIDYLLKPIDETRFAESFDRVKQSLHKGTPDQDLSSIKDVLETITHQIKKPRNDVIPIKEVGKIRIISVNDIEYLSGSGNYVEIFLKTGQMVLHREKMSTMENKLSQEEFIRIHRSSIVRISTISELMTSKRGDYTVKLKNGTELPVSRQCKAEILSYFK